MRHGNYVLFLGENTFRISWKLGILVFKSFLNLGSISDFHSQLNKELTVIDVLCFINDVLDEL